uniref:Phospholipase A1 n=1 Tax=Cacopsylla melanoneura TaxID=428564 RepID=A0A8D8VBB7_9HEMI
MKASETAVSILILILSQCGPRLAYLLMDGLEKVLQCYDNPYSNGSCPYKDITFWFYSRGQPDGIQITENNMNSLPVEQHQPWKIVFHGFNSNKDLTPGPDLKKAYLARDLYNLILLDYGAPYMLNLSYLCYPRAATDSMDLVSSCSARFLAQMLKRGVLPRLDKLHIIGHSLGAHTAASVCAQLNALGEGKVMRLTGLDPAGPYFSTNQTAPSRVMGPDDAQFVDAYHTNGGDAWMQFGSKDNRGDVDVRFNGGGLQPGCNKEISCNHQRAVDYFAESIYPKPPNYYRFLGHTNNNNANNNTILVGEDISYDLRGLIYVATNAQSPYAQGAPQQ